jgi:hypothetical protein
MRISLSFQRRLESSLVMLNSFQHLSVKGPETRSGRQMKLNSSLRWNDMPKKLALALALSLTCASAAHAATKVNCFRDDRPVKITLGKEQVPLAVPYNYLAWPRDVGRGQQNFVVLAARIEDGGPVCRATLNDLSARDFQLLLTSGNDASVKAKLSSLLKNEYPVKLAENEEGFTVWRGLYTTVEDKKTFYYELMVPVQGASDFDGYVICAGESITGTRLDRDKCTAYEGYQNLFLQYKFQANQLSELAKLRATSQQLADKVLGNPKE